METSFLFTQLASGSAAPFQEKALITATFSRSLRSPYSALRRSVRSRECVFLLQKSRNLNRRESWRQPNFHRKMKRSRKAAPSTGDGVEVVVCGDPWMHTAVPTNRSKHAERLREKEERTVKRKQQQQGGSGPREFRMDESFQEVQKLGATQFERWQQRQFEASVIEGLGGQRAKNQKMPYKMLQGIRAKRDRVAKLRDAEAQESGIVRANTSRVRHSSDRKGGGGGGGGGGDDDGDRKRKDAPLSGANVRGGVMHVPRHLLQGKGEVRKRSKGGGGGGGGGGRGPRR